MRSPDLTRVEGSSDQERAEVREKLDRKILLVEPETRKKCSDVDWNVTN